MESSCVAVALIENYSTSKHLKVSPEKSQILSCDTVVPNERYFNKVLKYTSKNIIMFWGMIPCSLVHSNVFEKPAASTDTVG
jgi:hypothetical protein